MSNGFPSLLTDELRAETEFNLEQFTRLTRIEPRSFWFKARNNLIVSALKKFFPDAQSFLEVGCGTGYVLSGVAAHCQHLSLNGSELSDKGLKFAAERVPHAKFFQMDALNIPFDKEFDVVGTFDVVEHIEQDTVALAEIRKAIKHGGGIMVAVPQHMWLWSERDSLAGHFRRYTKHELASKLGSVGFEVIWSTGFMAPLVPLMIASKMLVKYKSNEQVGNDLTPNPLVERVFDTVLNLEARAIDAGVSMPIGGSLLMLATRKN